MIADLLAQLDAADPVVRQDAANALGDLGHGAAEAESVLRVRLISPDLTFHDRTCAAWALSQIVQHGHEAVIADLLHVLMTETATPDAERLRYYCGFAIEQLATDEETLDLVRRSRESDPFWQEITRLNSEIPQKLDV